MSIELEEILYSFLENKVPKNWKNYSFLSNKPLASWMEDFK